MIYASYRLNQRRNPKRNALQAALPLVPPLPLQPRGRKRATTQNYLSQRVPRRSFPSKGTRRLRAGTLLQTQTTPPHAWNGRHGRIGGIEGVCRGLGCYTPCRSRASPCRSLPGAQDRVLLLCVLSSQLFRLPRPTGNIVPRSFPCTGRAKLCGLPLVANRLHSRRPGYRSQQRRRSSRAFAGLRRVRGESKFSRSTSHSTFPTEEDACGPREAARGAV